MTIAGLAVILLVVWTLLIYVAIPLPFQDPLFAWLRRQWLVEGQVLFVALGAMGFVLAQGKRLSQTVPLSWQRAWLGWMVWSVLSLFWSIDRGMTLRSSVMYGGYGLLAWLVAQCVRTERERSTWVKFLAGVAVIVCLEGMFQYLWTFTQTLPLMERLQASGQLEIQGWGEGVLKDFLIRKRIFSVFGWPNLFAGFLLLMIPLAAGLALRSNMRRTRLWWWLATGLLGLCLVLTLSMGAWIATIVTAAIVWGVMRSASAGTTVGGARPTQHALLKGALIAGVAIGVICVTSFIVAKRARPLILASTVSRVVYVQGAWNVIQARPLTGTGLGTFGIAYHALKPLERVEGHHNAQHAHNTLLECGAELGIVGLVLFGLFLVTVWRIVVRHLRSPLQQGRGQWLQWGLAVGVVGFFVHSVLEQTFVEAVTAPFWWIALGLLTGAASSQSHRRRDRWLPWGMGCALFFLSLRFAIADGWAAKGAWCALSSRPHDALQAFERAQQFDPLANRYPFEQGERLLRRIEAQAPEQAQEMLEQAHEQFVRTVTRSPWLGYAWFRLSQVREQLGHMDQAVEAMREAVKRDPNSREMRLACVQLLGATGRFDEARQMAEEYQRLEPSDPRGWFWEAVAWRHLQHLQQATAVYEDVLKRFPNHYPSLFNLAELYRMEGRIPLAIQCYTAFLQVAPAQDQHMRQAASAALATLRAN